jgi:hypothetical protein
MKWFLAILFGVILISLGTQAQKENGKNPKGGPKPDHCNFQFEGCTTNDGPAQNSNRPPKSKNKGNGPPNTKKKNLVWKMI